ncbi:glycosyltransferase family 4 protein [Clostridium sartagoforme]|uniref:glycosyltransferase family 4 protein n=1 Tax=Clostridium sartagoforme TaxID=84031 RepID=UPI0031E19BD2
MKKTVYMLTTMFYPSIGGVENHIYNLSNEFVKKGINVKIIKPTIGVENEFSILDGINVHIVGIGDESDKLKYEELRKKSDGSLKGLFYGYRRKNFYNRYLMEVFKYLMEEIKNDNSDEIILHQHDFISSIKLSKKLSKKFKVIFTNHTGEFLFLKKLPISKFLIKKLTEHFSYIIAPSNELADFRGIIDDNKYSYIPNGVNLDIFKDVSRNEINELRKKYDVDANKKVVICPRRWAPTKGIIYLVKGIKILNDRGINQYNFIFAGNEYNDYPEYKKQVEDYIRENKLEGSIKLLGNIDYKSMNEVIKLSDFVIIPSLMEAVSLSALEAMACEKVIIATNVGGLKQIIEDGKTGYLIEKEDEIAIADKLEEILNIEKVTLEEIGYNSRKFVENEYGWEKIAEDILNIYKFSSINKK